MDAHPSRETLSAYVDGMLDAGQLGAVQGHVAACAGCRQDLDGLTRLVAGLRQLERPDAPDLLPEIRRRLTPPEPAWRGLLARLLAPWPASLPLHGAALAAAALLLVVVVRAPLRSAAPEKSRLNAPGTDQISSLNRESPAALRSVPQSGQADKKKAEVVVAEQTSSASRTESSEETDGLGKSGTFSSVDRRGAQSEGVSPSADDAWGGGSYGDRERSQRFDNQDIDAGWKREEHKPDHAAELARKPAAAPEQAPAGFEAAHGPGEGAAVGRISSPVAAESASAQAGSDLDAYRNRLEGRHELQARLERGDALRDLGKKIAEQEQDLDSADGRLAKSQKGRGAQDAAEEDEPAPKVVDESRRAKPLEQDRTAEPATLNEGLANVAQHAAGDKNAGLASGQKEPFADAGPSAPDALLSRDSERGEFGGAVAPEAASAASPAKDAPEPGFAPAEQPATPARLAPRLLELRWHVEQPGATAAAIRQWVADHAGLAVATTDQHLSIRLPEPLVTAMLAAFAPSDSSTQSRAEERPPEAPATSSPLWVTISLDLLPLE